MTQDHDAMDAWLRDVSRILLRHLIKIGANREDAQEIVQEALYKWLLHVDAVDADHATAWLFRVTVNLYYDLCRKHKRTVAVTLDENLLVDEQMPEEALVSQEERNRAQRALEGLSITQRHLLILKYGEGLSNAAIGALMGYSPATVSTYLSRARAKYRKAYEEDANGPAR